MTKDEKTKTLQALNVMALALGQDVHEHRQVIYLERLKDLPLPVVLQAINRTIDTWKFNTYPPIGVIRDFAGAGEGKEALEDRAALAWDHLRALPGRAYNPAALECPITKKCFQALGGRSATLTGFGMWPSDQDQWKRKEFISLYTAYARNAGLQRECDQLESQGILRQIGQA